MIDLIAQQIVNGLISGSYYVLLGISWSLIFGTTHVFHFAHGLVYVAAVYAAVVITANLGLPLAVGFIAAIAVAVGLGCLIERILYRPLRMVRASMYVIFVTSLGVLILGQNIIQLIFGPGPRSIKGFTPTSIFIGGITFTTTHVFMVVVAVLVTTAFWIYLKRSKMGKAIRGVASNPEEAVVVGIERDRIYLLAFALGSGVLAFASIPYNLELLAVTSMGFEPLFISFVVTFIGGAGNIGGAVGAGILLGLIEQLILITLPGQWKIVITFVVLMAIIIIRPRGLFAKR